MGELEVRCLGGNVVSHPELLFNVWTGLARECANLDFCLIAKHVYTSTGPDRDTFPDFPCAALTASAGLPVIFHSHALVFVQLW